jgi:hypothetical protein
MIRLILIAAAIFAIFWCFNNVDFSHFKNDTEASMKNAKIIKTVSDRRVSDNNEAETTMDKY